MEDTIGRLLRAGLLAHLGDEPNRAAWLRTASAQLREQYLAGLREDVPSALLAAVDESATADFSVLKRAEDAIVAQWETFNNAYAQKDPVEVLRAVTFDAVIGATGEDEALAAVAWYTLRNTMDRVSMGRWVSPVAEITADLGSVVDKRIQALWSPGNASSSLRMPPVPQPKNSATETSVSGLQAFREQLKSAGNPQQAANALTNHLPGVVDGLVELVNQRTNTAFAEQADQLKDLMAKLGERLRIALELQEQSLAAVSRRDTLLWWRMAARSPLLESRYREAPDAVTAAVAAAFDLHRNVPDVTPVAVDHLLADVLNEADVGEQEVTIELMREVCQRLDVTAPTAMASPPLLVDVVLGRCDREAMPRGMRGPMAARDAALFLFRDLQVRRMLAAPSATSEDQ